MKRRNLQDLADNGMATWGLTTLAAVAAVNSLWVTAAACTAVTGWAWTVRWRRFKKERRYTADRAS